LLSYFWASCFYFTYLFSKIYGPKNKDVADWKMDKSSEVTVVLTSCARPEFLIRTLESFEKYNTYPIKEFIVIEDGGCHKTEQIINEKLSKYHVNFIFNSTNLGQLKSIDKAYAQVTTELVFHLEEDWEFTQPGFIEYSLSHLHRYPKSIMLSLRKFDDQQNHPIKKGSLDDDFLLLKPFWRGCWVGYGFNPSVRRMSDYRKLIGGYSSFGNRREISIGLFYYLIGMKVHVLSYDKEAYVEHIGKDFSTEINFKKA
jgi:GT2 family glycosyltransferase